MTRSRQKAASFPDGVEIAVGDLTHPESLPDVMQGIDALFLITPLAPDETHQGLAAIEAARAAGIGTIVFLSVHKLESGLNIPHFAAKCPIEHALRAGGGNWTILRPNNFFQNDLWLKDAILTHGVYPQPLGELGLNRVDVRDIAEAAAIALTTTGHAGQTYAIVGPDPLTGQRTAEIYSEALGRPVRYTGDDLDAWAAAAARTMPPWMVHDLKIMYDHFQRHGLRATPHELTIIEGLLGHAPRRFDDFARELAGSPAAASAGP